MFQQRRDQYGTIIVKRQKRHKIAFMDETPQGQCNGLAKITYVESYKEYNRIPLEIDDELRVDPNRATCGCSVF